ncbi:glycosyltransferase family 2 protein [Pseudarthrobacter niigatensis]|uniref:Glycosyltransferase involved in cell wall biosynthesis n=1 Tax=Pseudarthrobacter niigatensis TaxID=369935 RepID=A0AAJ1STP3_9MICC|nr:glycosyltransferase family 2 protein [Pseudarthrobacter niigatensis]MDQ0146996.1 glycosyltransferase involved in cell wall biosynthesis [Pseudarthrobacter niigatensis]MDQ0267903.1 glycosyltransferase involved in cell wall biosynthesis [Pseudarthrobacter niigatensis]
MSKTALPRVSVAVASYNYARYLEPCVRSALSQRHVDLEVIIVDDASTDESVKVAQKLADEDARVQLIVHRENEGHIATFNEALRRTTGDFVVKLDSDDMLTPGALHRGAQVLRDYPTVGMVYGNPLTFEDQLPAANTVSTGLSVWNGHRWLRRRCTLATNCIMQPETMVRRSVLHRTGGHRANVPAAHDLNLWLRIAAISDVARIRGADQGYYRVHSASLLRTSFAGYLSDLRQRLAAFDDFYETCDSRLFSQLKGESLQARTHRRLAQQAVLYAKRNYFTLEEADRSAYVTFALDTSPKIVESALWQGFRQRERMDHLGSSSPDPLERVYRIQDALTWRWWRRFGV